ncbi:MAG: sulfide/dihydroorotate dehydrogenase-like FAD/NAD-binding protein [Candidatus Omnitrophica bacterium]|nr:sulfide/dihydroorotate dehydrogenase-like FAD/NAD-binding protein [Candidatus Omnitrophota bacterium]
MYKIVRKERLNEVTWLFDIEAPAVAQKAQPGQFIILRVAEKSERIPLTIYDYSSDKGTVSIVVQALGKSTHQLAEVPENGSILDFVGPLGHSTEIKNFGKVVCVGGGIGVAPIFPIARALKQAGCEVISIIGARTKDLLILEDQMKQVSDRLLVCTDDGTYAKKGFVTQVLQELLDSEKVARAWAIGPLLMMKAVCDVSRGYKLKTIVSLNCIMVDGTGMCGSCRVSVDGKTMFACVDGPEFDGHEVNFEELTYRQNRFVDKEKCSLEDYRSECQCQAQK